MEEMDIWSVLANLGAPFVLMGVGIWYINKLRQETKAEHLAVIEKKENEIISLNAEIKDYSKDYKELANKSLSVLILVDDKLKQDAKINENVTEIHRLVQEIYSIQTRRG